ncbi:AEC family transporter [Candidatus Saccharibacteria bacterium]|nr:AEC family transporter [Candidatus Saccharibacteria bacterium]
MSDLNIFYSRLAMVGIIMLLGLFLGKIRWISESTNKQLINILLLVAMPAALFSAFPADFDQAALSNFLFGLGAGALVLGALAILGKLLFNKHTLKNTSRYSRNESQFALIFNNAAFLGLPLVLTIFGPEAMMPYCGFIIPFNLGLFGYGVYLMQGKFDRKLFISTLLNPNIIAVALGAAFFILPVALPEILTMSVSSVAGMMTPLSLICIGYMLSRADLKKLIKKKRLFITALVQLTIGPLATFGILYLLGAPADVRNILVLIQALPTATSLGLFAEKYGGDPISASELVVISTILSIVTLPIMLGFLMTW